MSVLFRFVSVFRMFIETIETIDLFQNEPKQTEKILFALHGQIFLYRSFY